MLVLPAFSLCAGTAATATGARKRCSSAQAAKIREESPPADFGISRDAGNSLGTFRKRIWLPRSVLRVL
ncbi:uncharacterized protein TRAVEDRAFT_37689 [Trametes versicolor FP-101664 SS1]|uniref:uncharacterized protein n=1 Tax=Trametes versicolor (strain FP-101664) TaxID=717944 RepID=UPI0004623711|nr:uncharacterized protein TRAVEDRAFT_37689 [Trametes versicolor FP-101664 SS1]EIW58996.1 hypothetical protein TRAVEDRAFT_37689 [Trametes versicolor FP-101664 SS1]